MQTSRPSRFYVAMIAAGIYAVVDVLSRESDAVESILRAHRKYPGTSFVLRHGSTGKRESVAEVMARVKVAA